jgi:hypothetical protein
MSMGDSVLMHPGEPGRSGSHYTADELFALPDYAEVGAAGLGFAYLPQPLSYHFHADVHGEDMHFWWDHPELHIHWARDIQLGHRKMVVLR